MKKTIAVIGSAAALSFAGAGLASAQDVDDDQAQTPEEVSQVAQQICGTISAYDFLGSASGVMPGLSGEECEANADAAVAAATSGDISGALDILRGIDADTPDDGDNADDGQAGDGDDQAETGDDTEIPAFGS